jgi:hypothetical protein
MKTKNKAYTSTDIHPIITTAPSHELIQRIQTEISTKSRGYGAQNEGGRYVGETRINSTPKFHKIIQN